MASVKSEVRLLIKIYKELEHQIRESIYQDTNITVSEDTAMRLMVESRYRMLELANEIAKRVD